jgi:hypothetical protein
MNPTQNSTATSERPEDPNDFEITIDQGERSEARRAGDEGRGERREVVLMIPTGTNFSFDAHSIPGMTCVRIQIGAYR